jgi:phosphonate metabolism-associated iron-containing alcohol dehydrogenase
MTPGGFEWHMPVAVTFGVGCTQRLPTLLGTRRLLVLAFAPAQVLGLEQRWRDALGARLIDWVTVPDGLSSVAVARQIAEEVWPQLAAHADCVLAAVGGGTTLDIAKVVRCRPREASFESIVAALRGVAPWPELALAPLWLVPTTAGTGSEVTRWATVWDTQHTPPVKRSLDEPCGYAERAFVDPALTLSCPAEVTRDCALDALSHALESIWNRHANPVSDRLAVSAARRILAALPGCLRSPADITLRSELAFAALEAGLAFSQTRTALAHALSYAVTLEQGIPHGHACALWLPAAWRLAAGQDARVDRNLQEILAGPDGAGQLQAWIEAVGVDARPESCGIVDGSERIAAALGSERGRNFIASSARAQA